MSGFGIGRVMGIELRVHPSWFVIVLLVLWTLTVVALPADFPALGTPLRFAMAAAITTLFFLSLLAHELAHSMVAVARGIPVHRITFFLFGGMAQTSMDSRSPGEEFQIAVAGPIVSLLLGVLGVGIWWLGIVGEWTPVATGIVAYVAALNIVLAVFNMLPGFPMDGGRILRAVLWRITGDVTRATRGASRVGVAMALLLIGYGIWRMIQRDVLAGAWLALIGLFVRYAATMSYRQHLMSLGRPSVAPDRVGMGNHRLALDARPADAGRNGASMYEIPEERLPPGFADTIMSVPAQPAVPRPAATTILLRDGATGPEVLLMRRPRTSGFVPGAWVFPGGRVDAADSGPALYERIQGLAGPPVPDAAFWTAALRELFEETGVLLARTDDGEWVPDAASDRRVERLRQGLMDGSSTLLEVVEALDAVLDAAGTVHAAHWITPVVEPRRYDTHFFAAALPDGRIARPDEREMTEAAWLTPADALDRFHDGALPMVFPTVKTLEGLLGFATVDHALDALKHRPVPPILPRLVRTAGGVAIVVDD